MRIVVADDSVLFREGLVRLLTEGGHEVVDSVGDADALHAAVDRHRPAFALIDVRMPCCWWWGRATRPGGWASGCAWPGAPSGRTCAASSRSCVSTTTATLTAGSSRYSPTSPACSWANRQLRCLDKNNRRYRDGG